jgi:hypothetical protein
MVWPSFATVLFQNCSSGVFGRKRFQTLTAPPPTRLRARARAYTSRGRARRAATTTGTPLREGAGGRVPYARAHARKRVRGRAYGRLLGPLGQRGGAPPRISFSPRVPPGGGTHARKCCLARRNPGDSTGRAPPRKPRMFRTFCSTEECGFAPTAGGRMAPGGIEPPHAASKAAPVSRSGTSGARVRRGVAYRPFYRRRYGRRRRSEDSP